MTVRSWRAVPVLLGALCSLNLARFYESPISHVEFRGQGADHFERSPDKFIVHLELGPMIRFEQLLQRSLNLIRQITTDFMYIPIANVPNSIY